MKAARWLIWSSFFMLASFQLTQGEKRSLEKDPAVLEALEERLVDYRRIMRKNCENEVIRQANEIVDSMLLEITRTRKQEQLNKPPNPEKPEQPEIVQVPDTSPIQPLWERDSLIKDSSTLMILDTIN